MNFLIVLIVTHQFVRTSHAGSGCIRSCNFPWDHQTTEPGTLAPSHSDKGNQESYLLTAAKPPMPRRIVFSAARIPVPESSSNPSRLAPGSTIHRPMEETCSP